MSPTHFLSGSHLFRGVVTVEGSHLIPIVSFGNRVCMPDTSGNATHIQSQLLFIYCDYEIGSDTF